MNLRSGFFFFFQAEDGIRDYKVTGVQTCAFRSKPPGSTGDAPGGPSRWSTERSGQWEPLAPKLVVEVRYDHVSGGRFRHGTEIGRASCRERELRTVGAGAMREGEEGVVDADT